MGDAPLTKDEDNNVEEIFAEEGDQWKESNGPSLFSWYSAMNITDILADYGWYLLLGLLGLYVIWKKFLGPEWNKWRAKVTASNESARYHKDPDLALQRLQGMEAARQRMQAAYNTAASHHAEKMKQKEEAKRIERIEDWERHKKGLGYCNKTKVQDKESVSQATLAKGSNRPRNNEYNPLMGSSSGSDEARSFRPSRKGRGGGCPSCQ